MSVILACQQSDFFYYTLWEISWKMQEVKRFQSLFSLGHREWAALSILLLFRLLRMWFLYRNLVPEFVSCKVARNMSAVQGLISIKSYYVIISRWFLSKIWTSFVMFFLRAKFYLLSIWKFLFKFGLWMRRYTLRLWQLLQYYRHFLFLRSSFKSPFSFLHSNLEK